MSAVFTCQIEAGVLLRSHRGQSVNAEDLIPDTIATNVNDAHMLATICSMLASYAH